MKVRKFADPQEAIEYGKSIVEEASKKDYYRYDFEVRFPSNVKRSSFVIAKTDNEALRLSKKFCKENWVTFEGFKGERNLLKRGRDYELKALLAFTYDCMFRPELHISPLHY